MVGTGEDYFPNPIYSAASLKSNQQKVALCLRCLIHAFKSLGFFADPFIPKGN